MQFYESERIIRKQERYEKSKAYDIIGTLKCKDLSMPEVLACIEVMSKNVENSESQVSVLALAHRIATYYVEQELLDATNLTSPSNRTDVN